MAPGEIHGHHILGLPDDSGDAQLMPPRRAQRHDDAVPDQAARDDQVQRRPCDAGSAVAEGGAGCELVAESERDREVDVEVDEVPRLVLESPACGSGGNDG